MLQSWSCVLKQRKCFFFFVFSLMLHHCCQKVRTKNTEALICLGFFCDTNSHVLLWYSDFVRQAAMDNQNKNTIQQILLLITYLNQRSRKPWGEIKRISRLSMTFHCCFLKRSTERSLQFGHQGCFHLFRGQDRLRKFTDVTIVILGFWCSRSTKGCGKNW